MVRVAFDRLWTNEFIDSNTDKYGHKYKPIPLTIELPPTNKVPITGFMVPPEQVSLRSLETVIIAPLDIVYL